MTAGGRFEKPLPECLESIIIKMSLDGTGIDPLLIGISCPAYRVSPGIRISR
jgi:hypothetical protein